ncbi:hypothetical protein GIB67_023308 [Kingdonia uniflora]|uniref:DUF4283 domain-containing protein n=1 Tax=Kingdonia uniflora TaxID=39325 RepID=A0A7J7KX42_9MAGN|nr:hypothetical protein GIB67_023308 [Kingdonia uniflora]
MEPANHSSLPLWVVIKNIHHRMRMTEGLARITSSLGIPLSLDRYTEEHLGTSSFVSIDIKAECDWPGCIPFYYGEEQNETKVVLEYAWIPISCPSCKLFGHTHDTCEANPKNTQKVREIKTNKKKENNQAIKSKTMSQDEMEGWSKPKGKGGPQNAIK